MDTRPIEDPQGQPGAEPAALADEPTATDAEPDPDSGRHPVNIGQLVMGIAFAGIVVVWALVLGDVVADADLQWLLPVPFVLAGAVGLVVAALPGRRRGEAGVPPS